MLNILVIAQSMVSGTVVASFLKREKNIEVSFSLNRDAHVLNQLSLEKKFDFVIFIATKQITNFNDRLYFLYQLFGCPIILLNTLDQTIPESSWLINFPNFQLNPVHPAFDIKKKELLHFIGKYQKENSAVQDQQWQNSKIVLPSEHKQKYELIAIGASTGGPQILNFLLKNLPSNLPVPILVVQHMPANFLPLFIDWLNDDSPLTIKIVSNDEKPKPGHVYFAPGDHHMVIDKKGHIKLIDAPPEHSVKPAVSYLFKSVAQNFGAKSIGILLTGMGKDGAKELALMKARGALTIAQNKESCVVFGMPKEAIKLNAAQLILSPEQIVEQIKTIFKPKIGEKQNAVRKS